MYGDVAGELLPDAEAGLAKAGAQKAAHGIGDLRALEMIAYQENGMQLDANLEGVILFICVLAWGQVLFGLWTHHLLSPYHLCMLECRWPAGGSVLDIVPEFPILASLPALAGRMC